MKTFSLVHFDGKKAASISCFGNDIKALENTLVKLANHYDIPICKKNLFKNSVTVNSIEVNGKYSTGTFLDFEKGVHCVVHMLETQNSNTEAIFNIRNDADLSATKMSMYCR